MKRLCARRGTYRHLCDFAHVIVNERYFRGIPRRKGYRVYPYPQAGPLYWASKTLAREFRRLIELRRRPIKCHARRKK